jgi:hypothetical protein
VLGLLHLIDFELTERWQCIPTLFMQEGDGEQLQGLVGTVFCGRESQQLSAKDALHDAIGHLDVRLGSVKHNSFRDLLAIKLGAGLQVVRHREEPDH